MLFPDPESFARELTLEQREQLLRVLLGMSVAEPRFRARELERAEKWLGKSAREAKKMRQKNFRLRIWIIFLLLRYGGMRLPEIFALRNEDLDCRAALLHVRKDGREIPLPRGVMRAICGIWQTWPGGLAREPLLCDASQVRRSLRACALACAIPPETLNARALRQNRAEELARSGLPSEIVAFYMGRSLKKSSFDENNARKILRQMIQREKIMKTSARNFFQGKILELKKEGILVKVVLETPRKLKVEAIITETSRASMNLAEGMPVNAIIKAPWVSVFPKEGCVRASCVAENCFSGKVAEIKRDSSATEIIVALPEGNLLCALQPGADRPDAAIREGAQVLACFSAFSVILAEA